MNYKTFTQPLITWYLENHRALPFRETQNPYYVWVSEIMAQQTQIATMLPYYERWVQNWPTIHDLAIAKESDVLKAWEGLGYYSRARNLHKSAQLIVNEYQGEFPDTVKDLQALPGVGDYTANAIASIAYHQKAIAVDGNVIRVMSRVLASDSDYKKKKHLDELKTLLFELLNDANPSYFTQSLMELGALVCTPKNPVCQHCPLQKLCLANKNNTQENYPKKVLRKKNPILEFDTFIIIKNNTILMSRDDNDGLMKGLWRLPQQPFTSFNQEPLLTLKHVFSHKTWLLNVYNDETMMLDNPLYEVIPLDRLKELTIITAHRDILKSLGHLK